MLPQWIIEKKRDGHSLSEKEIQAFISGFANGSVPDYQASAFAMAVFFQGMTSHEATAMTEAMMRSGALVDTSSIKLPTADKHSTGGIGDKVSLILAPLVACHNVAVPMISGRGLGITGGTLDKLESIPGYRTDLSTTEFLDTIARCGCSITGQTADIVPADKKLYALRDVTGTVPSIPLIAASIMSKKLAEGAETLVLDVKCGSGAFMQTEAEAKKLAGLMIEIGRKMDRKMSAFITDMNQPLGRSAGNALEVAESIQTLHNNGPEDLSEITISLASQMLLMSGVGQQKEEISAKLRQTLASGEAFEKFKQMVRLHDGDLRVIDNPSLLPSAKIQKTIAATTSGWITKADAQAIGKSVLSLGAGRKSVDDSVNHAAGVSHIVKTGEYVQKDQPLAIIHACDQTSLREASAYIESAFEISEKAQSPSSALIRSII